MLRGKDERVVRQKIIADFISIRLQEGIGVREAARIIGYSHSYLVGVEKLNRIPSQKLLERMCYFATAYRLLRIMREARMVNR